MTETQRSTRRAAQNRNQRPVELWWARFECGHIPIESFAPGSPDCIVFEPACDGFDMRVKRTVDGKVWIDWYDEPDADDAALPVDAAGDSRELSADERVLLELVESLSEDDVCELARTYCQDQIETLGRNLEKALRERRDADAARMRADLWELELKRTALHLEDHTGRRVALALAPGFAGDLTELVALATHLASGIAGRPRAGSSM